MPGLASQNDFQAVINIILIICSVSCIYCATDIGDSNNKTKGCQLLSTCVNIPYNLSLCHNIGYTKMRLPNILAHKSMDEIIEKSQFWLTVIDFDCHPDIQLFLCSLFSPVCLDSPIYPCRSLCQAVRAWCASPMRSSGLKWPDYIKCDKFPKDNDACLPLQSLNPENTVCNICQRTAPYKDIIGHYCEAEFVIKINIKKIWKTGISCRKIRILKLDDGINESRLRRAVLRHSNMSLCCGQLVKQAGRKGRLLAMGKTRGENLELTFLMRWRYRKPYKMAMNMMRSLNCSDPSIIPFESTGNVQFEEIKPFSLFRKRKKKSKPIRMSSVLTSRHMYRVNP